MTFNSNGKYKETIQKYIEDNIHLFSCVYIIY